MSLNIVRQPFGYKLSTNPAQTRFAEIVLISGVVHVNWPAHGFATGIQVYIKSNIENYNGFWAVGPAGSGDFFTLVRDGVSLTVSNGYVRDISGQVTVAFGHAWQAIHTPITYKINNTKFPTNTDDTIRTISTVTDSGGYCSLAISGDIKASGAAAVLEFVKITNSGGGGAFPDYDGVYQITTYTNETTFVISLPYDGTVDLSITNASIQYYYDSYHVSVQIYGGVKDGHIFETQKPYTLIATVDLIPDTENSVLFSVHEILKVNVELRNNLLLGTLPNNLDAFTMFYIKYAEVYDVGGTTLELLDATYTDDSGNFQGYAVNAKLPFKNLYSGAMSEYIPVGSTLKFLTLFARPTIFSGKYFDIGFISEYYQNFAYPALASFLQTSSGVSWTLGANPSVVDPQVGSGGSKQLYGPVSRLTTGITYRLAYHVLVSGAADFTIGAGTMNASLVTGGTFDSDTYSTAGGDIYGVVDVIPAAGAAYIYMVILQSTPTPRTFTIQDYWLYPVNDTASFNGLVLQQGGETIEVSDHDEGVYRQELNDPSCPAIETNISLYRKEILIPSIPFLWSNFSAGTAFDTKAFSTLTEVITTVSTSPAIAFTTLGTAVGEKVKIVIPITVSGGATFTTGIRVTVVLADSLGAATSNTETQTITADGSYTLDAELTATLTGTRIYVQAIRDGLSAGSATVVITIPETLTVQKTAAISETKTLDIDCTCTDRDRYLSWMNPTGGFDYWNFKTKKDRGIDILASGQARKNLFPTWPQSGGEFADTEDFQTYRVSKKTERIVSQHLTEAQAEALAYIKTSPLVQIVDSIYDRRTVIVDTDSFVVLKEIEKQRTIELNITYTDEIPSQTA